MRKQFTRFKRLAGVMLFAAVANSQAFAQISMGKYNTVYSQNFDALPAANSEIWEDGAYYLAGWTVQRTKAGSTIVANAGTNNTGALYSYGLAGSTDRALGSISSSTAGEYAYGLLLQNNTGETLQAIDVSFMGEQWRVSNSTAGEHRITFWYAISSDKSSFKLSPSSDIGWTQVPDLTFFSPVFYTSGRSLDGNAAANKRYMFQTLSVNIPTGHYIMLRWKDADDLEADHGLAIDDVNINWKVDENADPRTLPVELMNFTAKVNNGEVVLRWQTAMEKSNDYFVIERSTDGRIFESIGIEKGNGSTSQVTTYTFIDESPLAGASYYRLKQVDEDGKFSYSSVISVKRVVGKEVVRVFPTSTADTIHIENEFGAELKKATVIDVMGTKVLDVVLPTVKPRHMINVGNLASSTYVLVLEDVNGRTYTKRFRKI